MMLCSWLVILYPKAGIITFFTIVELQASIIENSYVLHLLGSTQTSIDPILGPINKTFMFQFCFETPKVPQLCITSQLHDVGVVT